MLGVSPGSGGGKHVCWSLPGAHGDGDDHPARAESVPRAPKLLSWVRPEVPPAPLTWCHEIG